MQTRHFIHLVCVFPGCPNIFEMRILSRGFPVGVSTAVQRARRMVTFLDGSPSKRGRWSSSGTRAENITDVSAFPDLESGGG